MVLGDPELDGRCPLRLPSIFSSNTGAQGSEVSREHSFALNGGKLKAFVFWVLGGDKMKCPERPFSHCHSMVQTTLLF